MPVSWLTFVNMPYFNRYQSPIAAWSTASAATAAVSARRIRGPSEMWRQRALSAAIGCVHPAKTRLQGRSASQRLSGSARIFKCHERIFIRGCFHRQRPALRSSSHSSSSFVQANRFPCIREWRECRIALPLPAHWPASVPC